MVTYFNSNIEQGKILVVEDSNVQAKKIKYLLEENGLPVTVTPNGKEALAVARVTKPIMIISDIVMPEMDGYELCSTIKTDDGLKDIPIILLTSLRDPLDIIKGLQAGADNFITKPYEDKYLISRIQYLLANRNIKQECGGTEMVIEVVFRGKKYFINSEKKQILDLLLSVYEAAVQRNDELIQTQTQLQSSNENLLKANQELEAFARTVSHDLRSPLSNITGLSELMLMQHTDQLDEDGINIVKIIQNSSLQMIQLVDDLLKFSQSGLSELELGDVNLSAIVTQVLSKLKKNNPDRIISDFIQPDLHVSGDTALMTIALENLIGNAWKYSSKERNAEIRFGMIEDKGKSIFYVQDNGAGFDMSKSDQMFNPFQRLHSSQEFPGTGVGLATVRRIIERHGGKIWAEGALGIGATFYFSLS
ncbi:MAG: response regulator [Bacteroidota bacterium]|nr:response regulator [Bacteroidota bacterium]